MPTIFDDLTDAMLRELTGEGLPGTGADTGGPGLEHSSENLTAYSGNQQYGVVYDLISQGEIEGLVGDVSGIFLNGTPMADSSMAQSTGAFITTGSITGGTASLVIDTGEMDRADAASFVDRVIQIDEAGTDVSGATFTTTALSSTVTATGSPFAASQESDGYWDPTGERLTIPGAGVYGGDHICRIIEVVSANEATVSPAPQTSVSGVSGSMMWQGRILSITPATRTITLTENVPSSASGAQVRVGSPAPVRGAPIDYTAQWNFDGSSASFMNGSFDQEALPMQLQNSTAASYLIEVNQQIFHHEDHGGENASAIVTSTQMQLSNADEIDRLKLTFTLPQLMAVSQNTGNEYPMWVEMQIFFNYSYNGMSTVSQLMVGRTDTDISANGSELLQIPAGSEDNGHILGLRKKPWLQEYILDIQQFQPFDTFSVEVKRVNENVPSSIVDARYTQYSDLYLKSVEAQVVERLRYPGTAYSAITFKAKDFAAPPVRSYHVRGLKIQVPTNYITREENNEIESKYTRNVTTGADAGSEQDWDGGFRGDLSTYTSGANREKVYCNNPAWVFYDVATNPLYGLGNFVDAELIDEYALYQISRYCDELVPNGMGGVEPRFTCNVYITRAVEAYKLLKDLATVFKGILYWVNGKMLAVQDSFKDPVYNFTQGNVLGGVFEYESIGDRVKINQVRVAWNDPQDHYRQALEVVEDTDDIIGRNRIVPTNIVAFGCTSKGQAQRAGRWYLTTNALEDEVVKFSTSNNASFLLPGDIINIQDHDKENIEFSGRISKTGTLSSSVIPLDRSVTLRSGSSYLIHCFFPSGGAYLAQEAATIDAVAYVRGNYVPTDSDSSAISTSAEAANATDDSGNHAELYWSEHGHVETKTVSTGAGTVTSISISGAFSAAPDTEGIWAISSDGGSGSPENVDDFRPAQYRILGIEEIEGGNYGIIASLYNSTKYNIVDYQYQAAPTVDSEDPSIYDTDIPTPTDLTIEYVPTASISDIEADFEAITGEGNTAIISWAMPVYETYTNNILATTTLASDLSSTTQEGVIEVTSAAAFSAGGGLARLGRRGALDSEWISFSGTDTGASPDELTGVVRGRFGSNILPHLSGRSIVEYDSAETSYRHLDGFQLVISGPGIPTDTTFNLSASQNQLSVNNLAPGTYTIVIRARNTRGNFSSPLRAVRTLVLDLPTAPNRVASFVRGGQLSVPVYFTESGTLSTLVSSYTYTNPAGVEYTQGSALSLDFGSMNPSSTAYWVHDASANTFHMLEEVTDNAWYSSDSAAANSPPHTGSFTWVAELDAPGSGLSLVNGTITTILNSSLIEGVGTSFETDFSVGDMIRLSTATTSPATLGTDAWYSRVSYIQSDTILYTESVCSKVFTADYAFKQSFQPNFALDSVLGTITTTASPSIWSIAYHSTAPSDVEDAIALTLNVLATGSPNTGEFAITGLTDNAADYTKDGYIYWNGAQIIIPRAPIGSSATGLTGTTNRRGFICVDINLGYSPGAFMVAGNDTPIAFVYRAGSQWYYDDNTATGVAFTPTADYVAIGWLETGSPSDNIAGGGLLNPVTLTTAAFPGATEGATAGTDLFYADGITPIPDSVLENFDDATAFGFNPTFSDWTGDYPVGWQGWNDGSPGVVSQNTTNVLTGPWSVQIVSNGVDNVGVVRTSESTAPIVNRTFSNDSVVIGSVDIYIDSIASPVGAPGIVVDLSDDSHYTRKPVPADPTIVGSWQTVYFTVSSRDFGSVAAGSPAPVGDFKGIRIYLMASWTGFPGDRFTGTVLFDNIRFTILSPEMYGGQLGINVYNEDGSPLGDIDLRNDLLVTRALNAMNSNPSMQIPATQAFGTIGPSGYMGESITQLPQYLEGTSPERDVMLWTDTGAVSMAALPANPDTTYEITALVRNASGNTTMEMRAEELYTNLPPNKQYIGSTTHSLGMEARDNLVIIVAAEEISPGYDLIQGDYTPSSSTLWFSPSLYNNAGGGEDFHVEWWVVRDKSTLGAQVGVNLTDANGSPLNEIDIRNDRLVATGLAALNANPSFSLPREHTVTNLPAPASWFGIGSGESARYNDNAVRDEINFPTTWGLRYVNAAFRVEPDTEYEIVALVRKEQSADITRFSMWVNESDSELGTGETAIANISVSPLASGSDPASHFHDEDRQVILTSAAPSFDTGDEWDLTTTYAVYSATYVPTSGAMWASVELDTTNNTGVSPVPTGDVLVEWCIVRDKATWGATVGTNLFNEAGSVLSDIDVRNDQLVTSALSAVNFNASMQFTRRNPSGGLAPAGWWRSDGSAELTYESDAVRDVLKMPGTGVVASNSAIRIEVDTEYEIVYLLRDENGSSSTVDLGVYEYDGDSSPAWGLPTGKRAIGDALSPMEAEIQPASRARIVLENNISLTTSYQAFAYDYTPTSTANWFSVAIDGGGRNVLAEWVIVRNKATQGAVVGSNLYNEAGALLEDVDIRNDQLIDSSLGLLNQNPTFRFPRRRSSGASPGIGTLVPANWFTFGTNNNPLSYVNDSVRDVVNLSGPTGAVMVTEAHRVETGTTYEFVALVRSATGTADIDVRAYEYDEEISSDIRAIGDTTLNAEDEIIHRTRETIPINDAGVSPSYEVISGIYIPTSTAIWFSMGIESFNDTDDLLIEWAGFRSTATLGATAGTNLFNEAGISLGDIDIRNDRLVTDALNGFNYNPSMQIPANRSGVLGPAGYIENAGGFPHYVDDSVRDVLESTSGGTVNMAAFRVDTSKAYEIVAAIRMTPTTNVDLRVEEYDSTLLPIGKQYIGSTTLSNGMQERTRLRILIDDQSVGSPYELISAEYIPTDTTFWASASLFPGSPNTMQVEWWIVREKASLDLVNVMPGGYANSQFVNLNDFVFNPGSSSPDDLKFEITSAHRYVGERSLLFSYPQSTTGPGYGGSLRFQPTPTSFNIYFIDEQEFIIVFWVKPLDSNALNATISFTLGNAVTSTFAVNEIPGIAVGSWSQVGVEIGSIGFTSAGFLTLGLGYQIQSPVSSPVGSPGPRLALDGFMLFDVTQGTTLIPDIPL